MLKKIKVFLGVLIIISVVLMGNYGGALAAKSSADTSPPKAPRNLAATVVTDTSVSLKWTASFDNKGVASYDIYKNSTYFATTTSTSYKVTGLTASTSYSFYVKAKDYSGNISSASNVISVKTLATSSGTTSSQTNSTSTSSSQTSSTTSSQTSSTSSTQTSSSSIGSTSSGTTTSSPVTKIVSGYYASWSAYSGYTPLNINASKLTNINYAFAKIGDDLKIALGDPEVDEGNFYNLNQLKNANPSIKTSISIGGWTLSGKFSDAALTDASRTVFADSVVAFIKQYGFDGVDIDWEYPVSGGLSTNIKRPEDKTNFTLLLQKLRQKLDAQANVDGKKYILSIAGGAGSSYIANTQLGQICNYIDYATIMTYDLHGTWDKYTDLNAPLYTPSEYSPQYKLSVDSTVKSWISAGFPASKIVLGVPFYGYVYNGVSGGNNGLYSTFVSGSSVSYDTVVSNYLSNSGFIKYFHSVARVPWLYNGSTFVTYDDAGSIAEKANYVKANNLAGANIWELSQNKNGVLLDALYSNLK